MLFVGTPAAIGSASARNGHTLACYTPDLPPQQLPMSSTYHKPHSVELSPMTTASAEQLRHTFYLGIRYRLDSNVQSFLGVHVPLVLRPSIQSNNVEGIHVTELESNSIAQKALPGGPQFVVLAAKLRDGTVIEAVPPELIRAWRKNLAIGFAVCLAGAALVSTAYAWGGALLLVLGSHQLKEAWHIPRKPFWVDKTCSA